MTSEPGNLISVRSDVAAALLIDDLFAEAKRRAAEPLDGEVERMLTFAAEPRIARLGYLGRVIELERFEVARAPISWLADRLRGDPGDDAALVGAALAEEEPLGKPAPADGSPTWRVPGPGGHVRHLLAERAVGDGPPELKRSWLLGFFVRCCEDVAHDRDAVQP